MAESSQSRSAGKFLDHARTSEGDSEPSIDLSRYPALVKVLCRGTFSSTGPGYLHYAMLHECASLGGLEYGLEISMFPWYVSANIRRRARYAVSGPPIHH
eukprot:3882792-Rhodomonas_salina.9